MTEIERSPRGSEPLPAEPRLKSAAFWERTSLRCLAFLLLGIAARLPALQGEFIWDDHPLVAGNPMIKSPLLVLEAFRHYLFPDAYSGHYRPVQTVSYIVDYFFWNTDTFGFHLSNICWHVASGLLFYFLLQNLFPALALSRPNEDGNRTCADRRKILSLAAFLVALLWIVHPVHSAAIDYISGRADSLVFCFASASWLLYLRAQRVVRPFLRRAMNSLAMFSALLALCSRESGLMWMLLFLLYLFRFENRLPTRMKLSVLTACLALVAIYFGLRHLPESRPANIPSANWSPPMRASLMLRALGDYGRLMIFPTNLHVERTVFDPARIWRADNWRGPMSVDYLALAGAAILGVLLYGARRRGIGQSARIFGTCWFLISYLPISNLFDLNATIAEHWLYLPSAGLLIFLAGVAFDLPPRYRKSLVAVSCLAIIALSVRSAIRSSDWVDPETFFRRTFAAGGTSSRIGVNLGVIYANRGEPAKAEAILRKVLQVSPDFPVARNNLALALSSQGKTEEAAALFLAASKAPPSSTGHPVTWDAALHLAQLRQQEKDTPAALAILKQARQDYPGTWELVKFEAALSRETLDGAPTLGLVGDFAREHWWHFGASIALGRLYLENGESQKAEAVLRHASWLDVYDAEALNLLARALVREDRLAEAFQVQRRAVARQPDQLRQHLLLSYILDRMGRASEARQALTEVNRLQAAVNLH